MINGSDFVTRLKNDLRNKMKFIRSNIKVTSQLISGQLTLKGEKLKAGDGAALNDESQVKIEANSDTDFLLFDLV